MAATPILDLQAEPPKPRSPWPQMLVGAAVGGTVAYFFIQNTDVLRLLGAFVFSVVIHECAHLAGGLAGRMKIGGICIGPVTLFRSGRNWTMRFDARNAWFGGFAKPLPEKGQFRRGAYAVMIAAGPAANLAVAALCGLSSPNLFWASLMCGVGSLIPMGISDGARLWMMRDARRAHTWMAVLQLQSEETAGLRPREWDAELFASVVEGPESRADYSYRQLLGYYRFLDCGDIERALDALERSLGACGKASAVLRACCYLEAAGASAYFRRDANAGRIWLARAQQARKLPWTDAAEAQIAMCEARYDEAVELFEQAQDRILEKRLDSGLVRFALEKYSQYTAECRELQSTGRRLAYNGDFRASLPGG